MTFSRRGPNFHPIATGIVLALYATDELYDLEIQRAPDVGGAPGTWATIAADIPGSQQLYTDRVAQTADVQWYRMRATGFGDTPSDWTASVSALAGIIPASLSRPPVPKLSLRNARQKTRDTATLVSQWDRDPRQDAVDVWERIVIGALTSSPWPELDGGTGLYPAPDLVLADTAREITFDIPTDGVLYAMAVPVDKAGRPGLPARWTITAVGVRPVIYGFRQLAGLSARFTDVWATIVDAQSLGGTLRVWVNHDNSASADFTGLADGNVTLTSTPADVTPSTTFARTGGGTAALFDNIVMHAGIGKEIGLEFTNTLGVSSGLQRFTLAPGQTIIDEYGVLVDEAIITAKNFAAAFRPPQPVSVLPPSNVLYGDKVVLTTDRKLYEWISGAWVPNTAPAVTLLNTLYGGAGVFGVVDAVAIKATSIAAVHMNIGILSDISPNMGIILAGKLQSITGAVVIDLNATGTNKVIDAGAAFSIDALGNAVFGGIVSASTFQATLASFRQAIHIGAITYLGHTSLTFGDIVSAGPTVGTVATITSVDYTGAQGGGLTFTGAIYADVIALTTDLFLPGGQVSYGGPNGGVCPAGKRYVLVPN